MTESIAEAAMPNQMGDSIRGNFLSDEVNITPSQVFKGSENNMFINNKQLGALLSGAIFT